MSAARAKTQPEAADSLSALVRDLEERGVRLSMRDGQLQCAAPAGILTTDLVERIRPWRDELIGAVRAREFPGGGFDEPVPLSTAQEPIWLSEHLDPGTSTWHLPLAIRIRGPLLLPALRAALHGLERRHDSLRTVFPIRRGRPRAVVPPVGPAALALADLSLLPVAEQPSALAHLVSTAATRPFRLADRPGWRVMLVRLGPAEHHLLITRHHLASDGWSFGILASELGALYRSAAAGVPSLLAPPEHQYADFARWERRQPDVTDAAVWSRHLHGAPFELVPDPDTGETGHASIVRHIPAETVSIAEEVARANRSTLFTLLATTFALAAGSAAGQEEIIAGMAASGRTRPELETMVGCFATVLPLRLAPIRSPDLGEALARAASAIAVALDHQGTPVTRIAESVNRSGRRLFDVALAFQNIPDSLAGLPGLTAEVAPPALTAPPLPLTVTFTRSAPDSGLQVRADHQRATVGTELVNGILTRFLDVLVRWCGEPELSARAILARATTGPDPARTQIAAPPDSAGRSTLGDRFLLSASRTPDAIAVQQNGSHLSYRALAARARAAARSLQANGIGPEETVAVRLPHTPDLVVAVVAVALSGGVLVPIDPADPPARQEEILDRAAVDVVLTDRGGQQELAWFDGTILRIDDAADAAPAGETPVVTPASLAYIIHTSGSTGVPKGVMVSHANAVALFDATGPLMTRWSAEQGIRRGGPLTWSLNHSAAFDFSVWEIWGPLLRGGRLLVVPRDIARDPRSLGALVDAEHVDVLSSTPSALMALIEAAPREAAAASIIVLGGERLDPSRIRSWLESTREDHHAVPLILNLYGITETTVHVTAHRIGPSDTESSRSTVGSALPGMSAQVVGPFGVPTVAGGPGELWVGGSGVARGYLRQPGLTADRFRPDPWGGSGTRTYRSGDRAVLRPGDRLCYLGRCDDQIKVRGHRIEPGEVEAALSRHPAVADVAVVPAPAPAGSTLVAYVRTVPGTAYDPADLRAFLLQRLPSQLVPARFVALLQLPVTSSGKLDRAGLAGRKLPDDRVTEPELPRTSTEGAVAGLWAELLGRDRVGIHDDFFELGGDSLMITRLHARLCDIAGAELPMRQIYRSLTVAAQASAIDELRAGHD